MDFPMEDEWPIQPPDDPLCPYNDGERNLPVPEHCTCMHPQAQPYPPNQTFAVPVPVCPQNAMPRAQAAISKRGTPRELRNKAEKKRRDKMNESIAELASIVPPVVAAGRKLNKTTVLKLTANYLRAEHYVFGDSMNSAPHFSNDAINTLLRFFKGFLFTTTYKGIVVVISLNVQEYLGYSELDLIGTNILNITHEDDKENFKKQLMPNKDLFGPNGELLVPEDRAMQLRVLETLASEKRDFVVRLKKFGRRSEPSQYVRCCIQGNFRKSDKACHQSSRPSRTMRRGRARSEASSSGNDVVFIGLVRPVVDTFVTETTLQPFRMEYRTRHLIDGKIIECDSGIALVTGYTPSEVTGLNGMNFMHRDDVRWVIGSLRDMYDQHRLEGESCFRLITKSGQFVYMKTKGYLEVPDQGTGEVTSFVCYNTVINDDEGEALSRLMKEKLILLVNNSDVMPIDVDENSEANDSQSLTVEDPRQLKKVILDLVTDLPSPRPEIPIATAAHQDSSLQQLSIIPPEKERILDAIDKIYSVFKSFTKSPITKMEDSKKQSAEKPASQKWRSTQYYSSESETSNSDSSTAGTTATNSEYSSCELFSSSDDSSSRSVSGLVDLVRSLETSSASTFTPGMSRKRTLPQEPGQLKIPRVHDPQVLQSNDPSTTKFHIPTHYSNYVNVSTNVDSVKNDDGISNNYILKEHSYSLQSRKRNLNHIPLPPVYPWNSSEEASSLEIEFQYDLFFDSIPFLFNTDKRFNTTNLFDQLSPTMRAIFIYIKKIKLLKKELQEQRSADFSKSPYPKYVPRNRTSPITLIRTSKALQVRANNPQSNIRQFASVSGQRSTLKRRTETVTSKDMPAKKIARNNLCSDLYNSGYDKIINEAVTASDESFNSQIEVKDGEDFVMETLFSLVVVEEQKKKERNQIRRRKRVTGKRNKRKTQQTHDKEQETPTTGASSDNQILPTFENLGFTDM